MKVLIIEDDPGVLITLNAAAKLAGISVVSAYKPEEAFRLLEQGVDLVWCDVGLPGPIQGPDILERAAPEIPAIICTGYERDGIGLISRYWKYVGKRVYTGEFGASSMRIAHSASVFLRLIKTGDDADGAIRIYESIAPRKILSEAGRSALSLLFSQESACINAYKAGEMELCLEIAEGLLDGTLC